MDYLFEFIKNINVDYINKIIKRGNDNSQFEFIKCVLHEPGVNENLYENGQILIGFYNPKENNKLNKISIDIDSKNEFTQFINSNQFIYAMYDTVIPLYCLLHSIVLLTCDQPVYGIYLILEKRELNILFSSCVVCKVGNEYMHYYGKLIKSYKVFNKIELKGKCENVILFPQFSK